MNEPIWKLVRWSPVLTPIMIRVDEAKARNLSGKSLWLLPVLIADAVLISLLEQPTIHVLILLGASLCVTLLLAIDLIARYRHVAADSMRWTGGEGVPELRALRPFIRIMWLLVLSPFIALLLRLAL
jgi:hypothetical protein